VLPPSNVGIAIAITFTALIGLLVIGALVIVAVIRVRRHRRMRAESTTLTTLPSVDAEGQYSPPVGVHGSTAEPPAPLPQENLSSKVWLLWSVRNQPIFLQDSEKATLLVRA